MQRRADKPAGDSDLLTFEYPFAKSDAGLGRRSEVLRQWQDQALGQRGRLDRGAVGQILVFRRMNAAVDVPDLQCAALLPPAPDHA